MRVSVEHAEREAYDLRIVGTGPAGIIVALEYQKLQPRSCILLIEYGTASASPQNRLDDTINIVETKNHHLPYDCTNKGVGGSSATWGGRCVMYDEIDFMWRKILNGQCTWNIALFHESRRYANRAAEYFECGDARFNLDEIPCFAGSRIAEDFQIGDVTDSVIERWSMPTRFGDRYGPQLDASAAIHLLTGWEAFSFGISETGAVSEVGIRD